jgi:hypothetical protein
MDSTKTSFKGDFCFKISIYRKIDDDSFKRVFSKISSSFVIFSKPSVYLNQNKKKKKDSKLTKVEQPEFDEEMEVIVDNSNEPNEEKKPSIIKHPFHQPIHQFPIFIPSQQ